jgi:hypothetical protein
MDKTIEAAFLAGVIHQNTAIDINRGRMPGIMVVKGRTGKILNPGEQERSHELWSGLAEKIGMTLRWI